MDWIESLFKLAGEVFRMIGEAINENKIGNCETRGARSQP